MGFDWLAIPLALGATVLPFFGVSWLTRATLTSPVFLVTVAVGLGLVVALVAAQYRKPDALMPVRLINHTLPVTGVGCAMLTGAGFTTLVELAEVYLLKEAHAAPWLVGVLVTGQIVGIAVAAVLFRLALPTRFTRPLGPGGPGETPPSRCPACSA